jgi:hypothetical protein
MAQQGENPCGQEFQVVKEGNVEYVKHLDGALRPPKLFVKSRSRSQFPRARESLDNAIQGLGWG